MASMVLNPEIIEKNKAGHKNLLQKSGPTLLN